MSLFVKQLKAPCAPVLGRLGESGLDRVQDCLEPQELGGRGGVEVVRGGILEVTRTLPRRNQSKAIHITHCQSQLLPSADCGNPGKALELSESVISPQKAGAGFSPKACRECVS